MSRGRAAARLMTLRRVLETRSVTNQQELRRLLGEQGFKVTQATVSRDLASLGAVKVVDETGQERYALSPPAESVELEELARRLREFVIDIGASGNLAVLKTPPGSAGPVAAALDAATLDTAALEDVLGSIGGDDTILVVSRDAQGGERLAQRLRNLLENGI